jgi:hypothetical protein
LLFGELLGALRLALEQSVNLASELERTGRTAMVVSELGVTSNAANAREQLIAYLLLAPVTEADEARCVCGPVANRWDRDAVPLAELEVRPPRLPLVLQHELDDCRDSVIGDLVGHSLRARRSSALTGGSFFTQTGSS